MELTYAMIGKGRGNSGEDHKRDGKVERRKGGCRHRVWGASEGEFLPLRRIETRPEKLPYVKRGRS